MAVPISEVLRAQIRAAAANRCGYCLTHQSYVPWTLEIEHIVPRAKGGSDDETNLWLACRACNLFKSTQTHGTNPSTGRRLPLFNPRHQRWRRHFRWSPDGRFIIERTAVGRATVVALNLNNMVAVTVRRYWVLAGWHPPTEL